jgi:hypothetical protein
MKAMIPTASTAPDHTRSFRWNRGEEKSVETELMLSTLA